MIKLQSIMNYVNSFDRAAQNRAFKGAQHPDHWEAIEAEYKRTKVQLQKAIKSLYGVETND